MATERLDGTDLEGTDDEDDFSAEDIALGEAMDEANSVEERLARLTPEERAAAEAQVKEDLAPTDFERLVTFGGDKATAQAESDAAFADQLAQAEALSPGYVAPAAPLTPVEEAAVVAAQMDPSELAQFTESLRAASDKLIRDAAIKRGELTPEGEPLEPPESPFDPTTLSGPAFNAFIRAAAAGGPVASDPIPEGFSRESWTAAVESAIAGGIDRG